MATPSRPQSGQNLDYRLQIPQGFVDPHPKDRMKPHNPDALLLWFTSCEQLTQPALLLFPLVLPVVGPRRSPEPSNSVRSAEWALSTLRASPVEDI